MRIILSYIIVKQALAYLCEFRILWKHTRKSVFLIFKFDFWSKVFTPKWLVLCLLVLQWSCRSNHITTQIIEKTIISRLKFCYWLIDVVFVVVFWIKMISGFTLTFRSQALIFYFIYSFDSLKLDYCTVNLLRFKNKTSFSC